VFSWCDDWLLRPGKRPGVGQPGHGSRSAGFRRLACGTSGIVNPAPDFCRRFVGVLPAGWVRRLWWKGQRGVLVVANELKVLSGAGAGALISPRAAGWPRLVTCFFRCAFSGRFGFGLSQPGVLQPGRGERWRLLGRARDFDFAALPGGPVWHAIFYVVGPCLLGSHGCLSQADAVWNLHFPAVWRCRCGKGDCRFLAVLGPCVGDWSRRRCFWLGLLTGRWVYWDCVVPVWSFGPRVVYCWRIRLWCGGLREFSIWSQAGCRIGSASLARRWFVKRCSVSGGFMARILGAGGGSGGSGACW